MVPYMFSFSITINSNSIKHYAHGILAAGETKTLSVPLAYIIITRESMTSLLSIALGTGYGATAARHAIFKLTPPSGSSAASQISYTPNAEGYSLNVTNSSSQQTDYYIIGLVTA